MRVRASAFRARATCASASAKDQPDDARRWQYQSSTDSRYGASRPPHTAAADAVCPPQSAWKSAWIARP